MTLLYTKKQQMKTRFMILSFLFVILNSFSVTQKDEIIAGLKTGSVEKLAKHFDNMVDVTVPGKTNSFSKTQAEMILKDFFNLNKVKNFEVQHSGSNASSNFIIGMLSTSNGNYRTTVYMRMRGDKQMIQGIEFEQKN
jgi:Domain of unknown function (DUF4783)